MYFFAEKKGSVSVKFFSYICTIRRMQNHQASDYKSKYYIKNAQNNGSDTQQQR